jgi:nucleotide-binding universal stress UspA family protein
VLSPHAITRNTPTKISDASAAALDAAMDLARIFHAAIEILHVDLDLALVVPPPGDIIALPMAMQGMRTDAAEKL